MFFDLYKSWLLLSYQLPMAFVSLSCCFSGSFSLFLCVSYTKSSSSEMRETGPLPGATDGLQGGDVAKELTPDCLGGCSSERWRWSPPPNFSKPCLAPQIVEGHPRAEVADVPGVESSGRGVDHSWKEVPASFCTA